MLDSLLDLFADIDSDWAYLVCGFGTMVAPGHAAWLAIIIPGAIITLHRVGRRHRQKEDR